MKAHCLFEQSGTFKNEFIKLGVEAEDYDIKNDFGETDNVVDLFEHIRGGYNGEPSLFDNIEENDIVLAFFPCTMFQENNTLWFTGKAYQMSGYTPEQKLEFVRQRHNKLNEYYNLLCMLCLIAYRRGFRTVIENPYTKPNYLVDYWCLEPSVIDKDRTVDGDYYKKPTQYWFINFSPRSNFIFEPLHEVERMTIEHQVNRNGVKREVLRSMIHPQYANRFIRRYLLESEV